MLLKLKKKMIRNEAEANFPGSCKKSDLPKIIQCKYAIKQRYQGKGKENTMHYF